MCQCKKRNQQETSLAAVAKANAREQQAGKYNYICHNHIRNHLADDECAFADRGDIDLLFRAKTIVLHGMGHACLPGNHRGRRPLESFLLEEFVSSLQNRRFGILIVVFHLIHINTFV